MARVGIVGIGHTRFGNSSEYDLADVLAYAATDALKDAGFLARRKEIDQVFVANMASGMFCHQTAVASAMRKPTVTMASYFLSVNCLMLLP